MAQDIIDNYVASDIIKTLVSNHLNAAKNELKNEEEDNHR